MRVHDSQERNSRGGGWGLGTRKTWIKNDFFSLEKLHAKGWSGHNNFEKLVRSLAHGVRRELPRNT